MKRYIIIFLSICAAVIQGCTDMSEDALTEGILSVESETLWFDASGGSQLVELRTYAGAWNIVQDTESELWCTLSKTEGTVSSSFEVLQDIAAGAGPKQKIIALGYAGWAPHQLETEIAENKWLIAEATPELVLGGDDDRKWSQAMSSLGISFTNLSPAAGHS